MIETSQKKKRLPFRVGFKSAIIVIAGLVVLPEILLQIGSFWIWYDKKIDDSQIVLCIADYQASYPMELEKALSREKLPQKLKVIAEMNEDLNIPQASKIIKYYVSKKKPLLIYLTLGRTEILQGLGRESGTVVWSDSFEWKYRSKILAKFLLGKVSDWKAIFNSDHFRGTKAKLKEQKRKEPPVQKNITKKTGFQERIRDPKAFQNFPLKTLASKPLPLHPDEFPLGKWISPELTLNFLPENKMVFGPDTVNWRSKGHTLQIRSPKQTLFLLWRVDGDRLLLFPSRSGFSFVLSRNGIGKESLPLEYFDKSLSAWKSLYANDLGKAEQLFKEIAQSFPDDPANHAGLTRVYWRSGKLDQAESEFEKVKKLYELRRDQRAAESLFSAIVDSPCGEMSSTASELLQRFPFSSSLWTILGQYSKLCGDTMLVEASNKRAVELFPDHPFQEMFPVTKKVSDVSLAASVVTDYKLDQIKREIENLVTSTQKITSIVLVPTPELNSDQNRMLSLTAFETKTVMIGSNAKLEKIGDRNANQSFISHQVITNFDIFLRQNHLDQTIK